MPTQTEKTVAFLNKMAAEEPGFMDRLGGLANKGLWGADGSFQQPAPAATEADVRAANDARAKTMLGGKVDDGGMTQEVYQQLQKDNSPANVARLNQNYGIGGKPLVAPKEAPGFLSNLGAAYGRGHAGTIAATGAAALLAGVLTYNMLKKKKNVKTADEFSTVGDLPEEDVKPIPKGYTSTPDSKPGKTPSRAAGMARKAALPAGLLATGIAVGAGGNEMLSNRGADAAAPEAPIGTNIGLPASMTTGSKGGDIAVGAGVAALGAFGIYKLYKALRGGGE